MAVAAAPFVAFAVAAAPSVEFVAVDMIDMAYFAESEGILLVVAERFDMAFVAVLEAAA